MTDAQWYLLAAVAVVVGFFIFVPAGVYLCSKMWTYGQLMAKLRFRENHNPKKGKQDDEQART